MDISSSILRANSSPINVTQTKSPLSGSLRIAISIIAGIGVLTAGVALGSYLGVAKVHSVILIATGCGLYFIFTKILSFTFSPKTSPSPLTPKTSTSFSSPKASISINSTEIVSSKFTYGKDAWKTLGVEIVDKIPKPPAGQDGIDPFFRMPFTENYIDFYIPEKIRFKGIKKDLTLLTLEEISGKNFISSGLKIDQGRLRFFLDAKKIGSGWRRMCKKNAPNSESGDGIIQKSAHNADQNFKLPSSMEAAALNMLLEANAKENIFETTSFAGTWCEEEFEKRQLDDNLYKYPIYVGSKGNGSKELVIHYFMWTGRVSVRFGINPVQRFLNNTKSL